MKGMWISQFGGSSRELLPELVSLFWSSETIKCDHWVVLAVFFVPWLSLLRTWSLPATVCLKHRVGLNPGGVCLFKEK